jgi:DNA-binding transcriptional MerR regulator
MKSSSNLFSIGDLVNFSCIKAHTFRTWENRYAGFDIKRQGNSRYYTLSDVRHLLKIATLNKAGFKISYLARLTADEIDQHIQSLTNENDIQCHQIHQLIIAMHALDIEAFEGLLDTCILNWGVDTTIENVILPFMERIQLFTYKGRKQGDVHFIVTAIRKKLMTGIEKIDSKKSLQKTALLYLPEGEHFDLILLYLNYTLKRLGVRILYLGTNVSLESLKMVVQSKAPDYLVSYIPSRFKDLPRDWANYMEQIATHTAFFLAGCEDEPEHLSKNDNVRFIHYTELASLIGSVPHSPALSLTMV